MRTRGDLGLSPAEARGVIMRDDIALYTLGPEARGDKKPAIAKG